MELYATLVSSDWTSSLYVPIGILVAISTVARVVHLQLFDRHFKLTFENAPVWSLFYFGFWTWLVTALFPEEVALLFGSISFLGYVMLAFVLLVVYPVIYHGFREKIGNPEWLERVFPEQGMLSLEERYIFAKIGDVVFQQCIAGVLVLLLALHNIPITQIIAIFLTLFIMAHLYIFRTSGFVWGMHYTTHAALGGFVIPFLVLYVPHGIVYSIIFHMLFYVMSSAFFAKLPYPNSSRYFLNHTK